MGDPALLPQPVFGLLVELGDAVLGKELRCRPGSCGFLGDCLGAVLTKLGSMAMTWIWIRLRTAHAVEPFGLIEL
ncbi:MAG TPA: hypothetical protein VFT17_10225 [Propionibacteriaceae bacterium]|nr:hypothetical protein [Propionibacteriaceae bacterium]